MPDKEVVIELGTLTSKITDEDPDEFYVLGAIKAVNMHGQVEVDCNGTFASKALTSFAKGPSQTKQLDPAGEAFHGWLKPSEFWRVHVLLMLVEQDTASDIRDVNSELIKFLAENQETIAAASAATGFSSMGPLAKLMLDFIETISNIFDRDDIFRTFQKSYLVTPGTAIKEELNIEVTHLAAHYEPWQFWVKIR